MKTFCLTTMIVLLLSGSFGIVNAQNVKEKACLDNTEQFYLTSNYVKGENYRIQVSLPLNYAASKKFYPVYYFADGDVAFGMIKEIADLLMMGNDIKDIIVVGIGYGQGFENWNIKRTRDLTPTNDTVWNQGWISGGADNFLKFIKYELFPVINKNYRTNPDSIAIGGHSLGGLLNSYILFKQPELFKNYVIGSPFLIWDKKIISKLENEYFSKHKELNCNVYIYYGSMDLKDEIIIPTNEFIQSIQAHNYQGINLVTRIYEGETHTSVPAVAITYGLKTIFKP
jgi:hypothetical protein